MIKQTSMTVIGDFTKAFAMVLCVSFLFLIVEFLMMGENALALFMIVDFIIPFSILINDYLKSDRDKKTSQNNSA
jgi:hypothetical protein